MAKASKKAWYSMVDTLALFYRENGRALPWRESRDPYRVWLSEIMLQQTRGEAVIPYYKRFLEVFPTVEALAVAEDDALFKCWEGLGYYSRARNLKKAAQTVMANGGVFPEDYEGLLALPGVGEYTAGAIGSICFGLPTPAIDGNVLRIFTRVFGIEEDISTPAVKKEIKAALSSVYPVGKAAGDVTQGFMEIGQRFCVPVGAPKCGDCPLRTLCRVAKTGKYASIPKRPVKKARKIQEKTVFILYVKGENGISFAIRKRSEDGLLAGLWEFPNAEGHLSTEDAFRRALTWGFSPEGAVKTVDGVHIFTHLEWHMQGILLPCTTAAAPEGTLFASAEEIEKAYPIASAFRVFKKLVSEAKGTF